MGTLTAGEQDLLNTCSDLTTSSDEQVACKLNVLSPENVAAQAVVSVETNETLFTNIDMRLHNLRSGGLSIDFSGLSVNLGRFALSSAMQANITLDMIRAGLRYEF